MATMNTILSLALCQFVLMVTSAVPPINTPPCPTNEVYKDSGFDCWTCSNYKIVRCAAITTPQCFCVDDYVRHDKTRQCIPKSECPAPVCGKYEDYKVGPNCQDCNNYATVLCLPINEKLCICKSGFVRHPITNACTLIEDCPVCPPNQIFNNDGNRDCQTCSNWQTVDCKPNSTPGCYCVDDFVHKDEKTRDCISTQACPKSKECSVNETWATSGYDCQTCQMLRSGILVSCAETQKKKCYCNGNFVRDTEIGNCVEQSECYPLITDCPDNEHYSESGYDCLSCQDIAAGILKKCVENTEGKCYCDIGFNRDTDSGRCILYETCENDGEIFRK